MSRILKCLYIIAATLVSPSSSLADGNGVITIPNESVKSDPIVVDPPEPYAFEDFSIEIHATDVYPPANTIFVDVVDNEIIIEFLQGYSGIIPPPFLNGLKVEVSGLPAGEYTVRTLKREQASNENPDSVSYYDEFSFFILDSESTQPAYTFYSDDLDHYFVTADLEEIENVEVGIWFTSDKGFNVWPADGPAPSTAVPVCRFYSYQVNSHFYTGNQEECTTLQEEDHGWEYEGIAFQALIPAGGACPAGTDPVWRLFNNRVAEKDSNHRFVASSETYRIMMADGWVGEGVAFCSPPASGE